MASPKTMQKIGDKTIWISKLPTHPDLYRVTIAISKTVSVTPDQIELLLSKDEVTALRDVLTEGLKL